MPADQDIAFVGQAPGVAVAVADRHGRQPFRARGNIGPAVADSGPGRNGLDIDDVGPERHDGLKGDGVPGHIGGGPEPVQGDARADQVKIGLLQADDAGAVGNVPQGDPVSEFLLHPQDKVLKACDLPSGRGQVFFIRRGKMGEDPFDHDGSLLLQLQGAAEKGKSLPVRRDPDPAHAGIHGDMDADGPARGPGG